MRHLRREPPQVVVVVVVAAVVVAAVEADSAVGEEVERPPSRRDSTA